MKRRTSIAVALGATAALLVSTTGSAHPNEVNDGALHDNRHSLHDAQDHDSDSEGHIAPDVNYGLEPIGRDPLVGEVEGLYTDVWADGLGYAYVGSFQEPTCGRSGVFISDIRDPANPTMVGQIKSPPNTRVNDVKTIVVDGKTVLIHTLEACGKLVPSGTKGQGGISLWDVTDPTKPKALKQNFLDFGVHNTFPWTDANTGKTYLIGVNDEELRDVFFVDISKPQSPKLLSEVGLPDWPTAQDDQSDGMGNFAASFNHDVWIAQLDDGTYQAAVSYWDAGFVTLDVTDPANPMFVDDSTYPDPDPITGFSPPEGNGHAAAYSSDSDSRWLFAGDEDFSGFRTTFKITEGPNAGEYPAAEGAFTKPIADLDDQSLNGSSTYVGLACGGTIPAAPDDGNPLTDEIAVIQRGDCTFQLKADTAAAAGYDGIVVFNDAARGDALVTMGGDSSDLSGIFVGHSTGLAIFGGANPPEIGTSGAATASTVEFDGYGYFHLLDRDGLAEVGYYAPGQVNDPDYATGFGDLTMHNVEGNMMKANQAFISWYSLGMRVVDVNTGDSVRPPNDNWDDATPPINDYYGQNVTEVGRFIAEEGSNFWGVTQTEINDEQYVLGSDRNTGLWIFQVDPGYCESFIASYECP